MERLEFNLETGQLQTIKLTAEEVADIKSRPQAEAVVPPTPEQKLAAAGLTVAELKELLGID
jgi:hypothetical protein